MEKKMEGYMILPEGRIKVILEPEFDIEEYFKNTDSVEEFEKSLQTVCGITIDFARCRIKNLKDNK